MKNKILISEIVIIGVTVVLIIVIQYGLVSKHWDPFFFNIALNLLLAITSGVGVGIFFEIVVRKNQRDETLEIVKMKKELEVAGIDSYILEFKDMLNELKSLLNTSRKVYMYFSYASSLINQISPNLLDAFKEESKDINIFMLSEENPFVNSYGNLWGKIDPSYDAEGIKSKIRDSKGVLLRLARAAFIENKHAKIGIYSLNYNPINYSFYIFDKKLILCPTKLSERKEYRALTLVCIDSNELDIFHWVKNEIDYIMSKPEAITKLFPNG